MRVVLTSNASREFENIITYYTIDSVNAANAFVDEFEGMIELIESFPEIGHCFDKDIRRVLMPRFPYLIYYRKQANEVVIYALFHVSRNQDNLNEIS